MTANEQCASPFASKTLARHLLRGVVAAGLIAVAIAVNRELPLLAIVAGIGAIVALRGCPMCWTIGLFETLRAQVTQRTHSTPASSRR